MSSATRTLLALCLLASAAIAAGDAAPKLRPDPVDAFMGEYVGAGKKADAKAASKVEAKVYPTGDAGYRVVLLAEPSEGGKTGRVECDGKAAGDVLSFTGRLGDVEVNGTVQGGELRFHTSDGTKGELAKTVRKSPTEGLAPPEGAIVLLPYEPGKPPSLAGWTNAGWKALPDGSMQVAKGSNRTTQSLGDARIHVEFRIPYEPKRRGQGRGNSGVYVTGRYEVQVIDSFGLIPRKGDCGAIYGVAPPKVNASLPPLAWQTYDITFRGPRFDKDGKPTAPATMTVLQNGIKIHDAQKLPGSTPGGAGGKGLSGPLLLQDHGHPVRYRNIWAVPLKDEPEPAEAGWRSLFNGRDLTGWTCRPNGWQVTDGAIARERSSGFLWSKEKFGNFVLDLEFKISSRGNSGIFLRTASQRQWLHTGIEVQVLDSHGKKTVGKHDCGAIYDCLAPGANACKPAGEWNHIVVTCRDNRIQIVLNDVPIIDMDLDKWTEAHKNPDGSRNKFNTAYKDMPRSGYIGFQDHGNNVYFRNIRIKLLD